MTTPSTTSCKKDDENNGTDQPPQELPAYTHSHASLTPSPSLDGNQDDDDDDKDEQQAPARAPTDNNAAAAKPPSAFSSKFHSLKTKAGRPLNKAAKVLGVESWWPTNMARECGKAARILHSFTDLTTAHPPPTKTSPPPTIPTHKSILKIPDAVLRNCAGLAIFSIARAGVLHGSLAAGFGVAVARRTDGTWSPPSSFVVTTVGAGFMFGLDICDCVCVLNTPAQVRAFARPRVSLGGDASVAIGPVGGGAIVDAAVSRTPRPVWSYIKSRGLWAGIQIDGTVMVARADANAVFYERRGISAATILGRGGGDLAWPLAGKPLFEVLRAIEGNPHVDHSGVHHVASLPPPVDTVRDDKVVQTEHSAPVDQEEPVLDEKEKLRQMGV